MDSSSTLLLALVVLLLGAVLVVVLVVSWLCRGAMRTGDHFAAKVEATSRRLTFNVCVHPAPRQRPISVERPGVDRTERR